MKKIKLFWKEYSFGFRTIFKIMRIIIVFFYFCITQLNAAQINNQKLTFKFTDMSIENVLFEIEKKTNYKFIYNKDLIDVNKHISINVINQNIINVLDKVFVGREVVYKMVESNIIISPIFLFQKQQSSGITIKGKVTDKNGEPLPGVNVYEKDNPTHGVITNIDGFYTIKINKQDATLVFSFVGFKKQEVKFSGRTEINISLMESSVAIDEIVAIGYGTQRRSLVTNAISKIKIDNENMRFVLSPGQLIEGRIAGVMASTGSGNLGSSEGIRIRGASSLSASNEPLYVVDGVPITNNGAALSSLGEGMSSLALLNLNDIESINILKDAASAAIYGSRATNGVVVITTKSGRKGKPVINVNYTFGLSRFANENKIEFVDSNTWLDIYNEGIDNYNKQNHLQVGDPSFKLYMHNPFQGLPDTDWLGLVIQTGLKHKIDASFSGGNKKGRYYLSTNYDNEEGIIKTNALQKINFTAKFDFQLFKWLEIGCSNNANYMHNERVPGANIGSTIIARAVEQRPFDRPYKPNGDYYIGGTEQLMRHNPVQILNEQTAYVDNYRFIGNYYGKINFTDKLSWKTSFGTDVTYTYDYVYYKKNHPYGTGVGRIVENNRLLSNNIIENVANYNDIFGEFTFSAMAGQSYQKLLQRRTMIDGRGFPSPSFDVVSVASEIYNAYGTLNEYALISYYGRVSLSYKEKYLFNGTLRTDGSSKFAPDKRWGIFPSVSLGWNVSQEDFMKDGSVDLKFRASYGKTGNQGSISFYAWQPLMSGGRNYGGESGIAVSSFGNPDVTWETADQYDIGLDVGLWNGKINSQIDFYLKNTNNLLYAKPVPSTTGMSSIISNIGSMRNKGFEFTLNTYFNLGKVNWKSQFNISSNNNKITKLLGENEVIPIGSNRALQEGKEIGAYYLFSHQGIYQYDGEVPDEQYDIGVRAGDIKWKDVDGNNIINDNDRIVTGSSNPDFFGGWNNSFSYKQFQFDIFTTYTYGNDIYAEWKPNGVAYLGYRFAYLKEIVDNRWTGPGTSNKYPRSVYGFKNNHKSSDLWLEDGSNIRIRTITISYNFKPSVLTKIHLKKMRLFAQADNLFLFTKYSGWDPEVSSSLDPRYYGIDKFSLPQPLTISFGANVSF